MISMADLARLSIELQARFPEEDKNDRLVEWLESAGIGEEAFDQIISSSISAFSEMMLEQINNGRGEHIEAEDNDGNTVEMSGLNVGPLVGSIACNMFILGYETAAQYGQSDMSDSD